MKLESAALARLCGQLEARVSALRSHIEHRCHVIELAPDLAQDIGSKRWFRGLGTMLGLSLVAVSFWPDLTAVEAATAMPVDQPVPPDPDACMRRPSRSPSCGATPSAAVAGPDPRT